MTTGQDAKPERRVPAGLRAERKRRDIVTASREVFIRDGYDADVGTIAAEAGVSKVTVYNHFGSKEALFIAVVVEALDEALGATAVESERNLTDTDDLREALTRAATALVAGVTTPPVRALRNLVTGELRRFPQLAHAWRERGPERMASLFSAAFETLVERGDLHIPDMEVAVMEFYGLTLYPHLVASSLGGELDPDLSQRLIERGVEMFLAYYSGEARKGSPHQ